MSRANPKKKARRNARRSKRAAEFAPEQERELATLFQQIVWHGKQPPASVDAALRTDYGRELSDTEIRTFTDLDTLLTTRGWSFFNEYSGPEELTWTFDPAYLEGEFLERDDLEPGTSIAATFDRLTSTDAISDCEVEVNLVGSNPNESRTTGLAGLMAELDNIEAHRLGDLEALSFPVGRARVRTVRA